MSLSQALNQTAVPKSGAAPRDHKSVILTNYHPLHVNQCTELVAGLQESDENIEISFFEKYKSGNIRDKMCSALFSQLTTARLHFWDFY